MSGRRTGPLAAGLRGGLWLASFPYRGAVAVRNRQFDRRRREVSHCGVPVISVGNLTTGGTGKTPIVCLLARRLRERNLRVAIVSRGYGRGEMDCNDEALELHARLPDVPHVQDADRVEAARVAVEELESQVILMDDGFQHRRLHRDLDIVVIDATCPFGYGYLLPRGLLREPISGLKRADLVIISRCRAVDADALAQIESVIRDIDAEMPIVHCHHQATTLLEFPDRQRPIEHLKQQNVAVVSAIGNPTAFEATVRQTGANVVDAQRLPDHDPYAPQTVEKLENRIRALSDQIERVICTHKDLVKLQTDRLAGKPLEAILIELDLAGGEDHLETAIGRIADSIAN